jgi:hypothetical protein
MASLIGRLSRFAQSPQGKRMMRQAQDYANRPETKRKIEEARAKLARKRGPS